MHRRAQPTRIMKLWQMRYDTLMQRESKTLLVVLWLILPICSRSGMTGRPTSIYLTEEQLDGIRDPEQNHDLVLDEMPGCEEHQFTPEDLAFIRRLAGYSNGISRVSYKLCSTFFSLRPRLLPTWIQKSPLTPLSRLTCKNSICKHLWPELLQPSWNFPDQIV